MILNLENIKDEYGFSFTYCFYNLKKSYVFTSQKVCTRSFYKIVDQNKADRVYNIDLKCELNALVRNPYSRIESLYRDKFHKSVDKNNVQHCQKEIIKIFGMDRFFDRSISFDEFVISGLSKLITTESHFYPQTKFIPEYIKNIFRVENSCDLYYIFSLFNTNIIHEHKTVNVVNSKIIWTDETKSIVEKLYSTDFKRFNYNTHLL